MSEELKIQKKMLEELGLMRRKLDTLGLVASPNFPTSLPTLDGWTWKQEILPARLLIQKGIGPVDVFPPIVNERGWLTQCVIVLSDPDMVIKFHCDNWDITISPRGAKALSEALAANNALGFVSAYNPGTIVGPVYTLSWAPSQFWPYNSQVRWTVQLPSSALCGTGQVVYAQLGRHFIRDAKQFYESIHREGRRQATGIYPVKDLHPTREASD